MYNDSLCHLFIDIFSSGHISKLVFPCCWPHIPLQVCIPTQPALGFSYNAQDVFEFLFPASHLPPFEPCRQGSDTVLLVTAQRFPPIALHRQSLRSQLKLTHLPTLCGASQGPLSSERLPHIVPVNDHRFFAIDLLQPSHGPLWAWVLHAIRCVPLL